MQELPRIWIRMFWGFEPEHQGYLGFNQSTDRERFIANARETDLVLIVGTKGEPTVPKDQGRVLGVLQIDPVRIYAEKRMSQSLRDRLGVNADRWQYAVPVRRAWRVQSPRRVEDVATETYANRRNAVSISNPGRLLTPADAVRAFDLSVLEVNVFGELHTDLHNDNPETLLERFRPSRGLNPTFGPRTSLYDDGIHFLYMLRAKGCVPELLGRSVDQLAGKTLVKVGFSNDPERRCAEHNVGLPPSSKLRWKMALKSKACPDGQSAKLSEDKLKLSFETKFESLGGEFFLGPLDEMMSEFLRIA